MKTRCLAMACTMGLAACGSAERESTQSPKTPQLVDVRISEEAKHITDYSVQEDLDSLTNSLTMMAKQAQAEIPELRPIVVTFTGRGEFVEEEEVEVFVAEGEERTVEDRADIVEWDTVRVATGNEFRVDLPIELVRWQDAFAQKTGLNAGSEPATRNEAEAESASLLDGEAPNGQNLIYSISSNGDQRTIRGTVNVAQTHTAFRKMVDIGSCTGTQIGPKHIITAAHCLRNESAASWNSSTARVGRSGSAWRDSVSFSTSNAWYWTPSQYRTITDGQPGATYNATPYDLGVVVTHNDRTGDTVGWMGWHWWSSNSTFDGLTKYLRGYPLCGRSNSPPNCVNNALYGTSASCSTAQHSSPDSDGIERRFRHSCDTNAANSGSSLYTYLGSTLAVVGIHSWGHGDNSSSRPNTAARITQEYSGTISALRSMFP